MKSRFARLGVLLAAFVGLMATMVPTASADNVQNVTFAGTADLSDCIGLGYPGVNGKTPTPTVTTKTGPKGEPEVNVNPGGNHCNFTFSDNGNCFKTSVGKTTSTPTDPPCTIAATGTVWGFCGLSHGKGTAQITSNKGTTRENFSFNAVGGELVVSGGTPDTNFYGVVTAIPPVITLTPGSCTNKTALTFTIVGEVKIKDCTSGTTAGVCNGPL